jgi:integrase
VRDQAVLLLLVRLGLRAGDVVALRINDIDWRAGTLRVTGKGRRETRLPMPQDVGDALLDYLKNARVPVAVDRVFLRVPAPFRPFKTSACVSNIVCHALRRARIENPPSKGANLLRHYFSFLTTWGNVDRFLEFIGNFRSDRAQGRAIKLHSSPSLQVV